MKYMIATAAAAATCILLGTALAWLAARRRNMPPRRKALLAAVFSVLLLAVVSLGYLETYYKAGETAKAYLTGEPAQDAAAVSVQKTDTGYFFDGPGESSAIIFYGGAKVEETAYAPLLYMLSQRGADCFLVKAPFRVAVIAAGAADTQEIVIEGGNHAQFGDYGPQKGDGTAQITPEEQWEKTADAVMNLLHLSRRK